MRLLIGVSLISVISMAGCGGSALGGTTNPDSAGTPSTSVGTMSARIDGILWTATNVIATRTPTAAGLPYGLLAVSGTGSVANQTVKMTFAAPSATGIYTVGPLGGSSNPQNGSLTISSTGAQWNATAVNGSGTITLTSYTLTGAGGNFAFNLTPLNTTTATGTRAVTEGAFSVSF